MWHRLLLFLRLRNPLDWAPPIGPEVSHPYVAHVVPEGVKIPALNCCNFCGGGSRHKIHRPPFNARRASEVMGLAKLQRDTPGGFIEREH
jgi:hypothetical protein